jgi:hypothetical protein
LTAGLAQKAENQKENKKSIYLRKQPLKKIDDDFIFVELLCCCLFKLFMELM